MIFKEEAKKEFKEIKETIKNFLIGSIAFTLLIAVSVLIIFGPTVALVRYTGFSAKECAPFGLGLSVFTYIFIAVSVKTGKDLRNALFEKDKS